MSVDLVGSTAFKARFAERENGDDPLPQWVRQIRHFYTEFPKYLSKRYDKEVMHDEIFSEYAASPPRTWKTIGDEIIFCCRILTLEHLACCSSAFLKTLDDYGSYLDSTRTKLDVKGAGWTAAFPAPNITVEIASSSAAAGEIPDESIEIEADKSPNRFDFLGKEIDSGFRSSKFAAADKFTASLELASLLSFASRHQLFAAKFTYHGRQVLKGVIADRPYPIVTIDSERSVSRREVRTREKALTGEVNIDSLHLCEFLEAFMRDEGIDLPNVPSISVPRDGNRLPECYNEFKKAWNSNNQENEKRERSEQEASEMGDCADDGELPQALDAALSLTLARSEQDQEAS
ncbi:MAG: hypothetical protein HC900_13530 [Methylacidiphilales bacterium]|nr:hypothetical protein [Candidatus Methylacidiphilales bacterium]